MANEHLVFVYGTLRAEASDLTPYILPEYEMYSAGAFPYIIPSEDWESQVTGQVLSVDDTGLEALDEYEGLSRGLYTRERVGVLKNGKADQAVEVWAYVAGPALNSPRITSGDWISYRNNRR